MTDRWDDFDCALATSLSALPPPEETVRAVTPFRAAMGRVVWGLCLTSVTLNFWYLSCLLPALGAMLLVLGLRSLRRNNIWFRFCWFISIYQVIYLYGNTALAATPFSLDPDWLPLWLRGLEALIAAAALFFCLWRGLVRAADEVGQPRRAAAPALWALGWYAVVALLGVLWPQPGWAVGLAMLAAFVCIVRSLLRLSAALDGWGYAVRAAPVKIGGGKLAAAYLLSLAVLTAVLSLASNHLPVEACPVEQTFESAETAAIRADLTALGFPEEWLDLLPENEIAKLSGASGCYVNPDAWGDSTDNGVRYTDIQVQTGWRTFRCYHFFTVDTPRSVLQNQISLSHSSYAHVSDAAGQILWEKDGTAFAAELPLEESVRTSFFGDDEIDTALFSYPLFATERQGWCAYSAVFPGDWIYGVTILFYQTQALRNLYPYAPLPEQPIVGILNDLESQSYSTYPLEPQYAEDLET